MKPIQILLLGPPQIYLHGQPVFIPTSLSRGLLYYLAANRGSAPPGRLAYLLDSQPAENGMPDRLHLALQGLEQGSAEPGLFLTGTPLRLNTAAMHIDQIVFQDLLDEWGRAAWQAPKTEPLSPSIYAPMAEAADLWRGPQYMAGFQPDTQRLQEWLATQSHALERLYGSVLERLADHHLALNEIEPALDYTRRALLVAPLNESLHEQYLRALIDLGRAAEAQAHFEHLQALLLAETGNQPGRQLVRQYGRIHPSASRLPVYHHEPEWRLHHSLGAPFVGRQPVLASLERSFQNGGGLLLRGEAGGGKTRLLQEFIRRFDSKPRVFLTACQPQEKELPFKAILDMLRFQIQPDEWLALSPASASQLSLLLPELREMRPEIHAPQVEAAAETLPSEAIAMLFEAIRELLLVVAAKQRVFLCLDDAQWADDASLRALEYLLQGPPFERDGLLLLAARSEVTGTPLEAWAKPLLDAAKLDQVQLDRLTTGEITQLAESVLAKSPHPQFIAYLERETGGNPLFILESLSAWLETQPSPGQENPDYIPLSFSLKSLILDRLNRLPISARETLAVAAVAGQEFDPEVVGRALEQRARVFEELRELEQRGLVASVLSSTLCYAFVHNKIRETLIDDISPQHKRELHLKIAQALEAVLGKEAAPQAVILAEHFEQAGHPAEAFDYWLAAARRARYLYSLNGTLQALQRAAVCAGQASSLADKQLHTLYLEWLEACHIQEDQPTLERISQELLDIGQARGSQLLIGAALNGFCEAALVTNQFRTGMEYAARAIAAVENTPHREVLMDAYNHYGTFLYMLGQVKQAMPVFKKALAAMPAQPDDHMRRAYANAHYQLAVCSLLSALPGAGLRHAEESLSAYTRLNRYIGMVNANSVLSMSHYYLGNLRQARLDCERGLALGERIRSARMVGYLHTYRAIIGLALGELETAVQHARLGIATGERYGHGEMIAGGYEFFSDLYLWLRDIPKAVEFAGLAREHGKNTFMELDASVRLGFAADLQSQENGSQMLEAVERSAAQAGLELVRMQAQVFSMLVFTLRGQWKRLSEGAELLRQLKRLKLLYLEALVTVYLAESFLSTGKPTQATKYARSVARTAQKVGYPWLEILARSVLYRLQRDAHGASSLGAEREYGRIQAILASLEAGVEAEELSAALARLRADIDLQLQR